MRLRRDERGESRVESRECDGSLVGPFSKALWDVADILFSLVKGRSPSRGKRNIETTIHQNDAATPIQTSTTPTAIPTMTDAALLPGGGAAPGDLDTIQKTDTKCQYRLERVTWYRYRLLNFLLFTFCVSSPLSRFLSQNIPA